MKRDLLFIFLGAMLAILGTKLQDAVAQQPAVQQVGPLKIAIINTEKAIAESEKGKQVISKIQAEVDQAKAKLEAQEKELKKLDADYQANKDKWDIATRQAKAEEIENKLKKLNRDREDYSSYYQRRWNEQMKPIATGLNQTIEELGKKEGYSIIFDRSGAIVYFNPALEITDKVISSYNLKK